MKNNQDHFDVLRKINVKPDITQRELAEELGFSLGKLNYCMIGPDCYLNGGVCYQKPNTGKFERESCRIDRKNVWMSSNVNMCRNVRLHWTPEHDKKDDVDIPIPIIQQTKTCWHCPLAI